MSLRGLAALHAADDEQNAQHQRKADGPGNIHVLDETGHDEANHADTGHRQHIGDLGGNVLQMVTLRYKKSFDTN